MGIGTLRCSAWPCLRVLLLLLCSVGIGVLLTGCGKRIGTGETIVDPLTAEAVVDPLTARKGFVSNIKHVVIDTENNAHTGNNATVPPAGVFDLVHYPSPTGSLAAYLSPDPRDGKKHPAIVWAHGGFGGIDDWLWKPDDQQDPGAFRQAGFIVMCPSWRGENDNPGQYEMFYGEIEDACAAIDYLAKMPYVDPTHIYMGGHSTGGTVTLLTAESSTKLRAAFAFGGAPNMLSVVRNGSGYGNTPFDYHDREESRLRSPIEFTRAIHCPTWYFEGADSAYCSEAVEMQSLAQQYHIPFYAHIVEGGNHFTILQPINRLLAQKMREDTGPTCTISISDDEVTHAFAQRGR